MSQSGNIAIRISHLSKMFKVYNRPADMFWEAVRGKPLYKPFWALHDITFTVRKGQVVGIIGRNGAGKSTLLKIITGTLDKTSGDVEVMGRISSILELGTGFNGEYSGRENIYLGGLMVGLTREEIAQKEDWIIQFSELEEFIEQPFKTYSTGMQARLTFATAVCIDPDILIIDEALSVGDARFQRKSFNKIEEFREQGNTILLVSHDINTINTFCDYAILLEKGQIYEQGEPQHISKVYYKMLFASQEAGQVTNDNRSASEDFDPEIEIQLNADKIVHAQGYAWSADLSAWEIQGDSLAHPQRSEFVLLENDTSLRPAHWPLDQIGKYGKGGYSHWDKHLYFSTSDNTDPRTNGRTYIVRHQRRVKAQSSSSGAPMTPEREAIRRAALQTLGLQLASTPDNSRQMRMGTGKAEILDYGILDEFSNRVTWLSSGKRYTAYMQVVFYEDIEAAVAGFLIRNSKGMDVFGISTLTQKLIMPPRKKGDLIKVRMEMTMWLTNGVYFITFAIADPYAETNVQYDMRYDALQFEVEVKQGIFTASLVSLDAQMSYESYAGVASDTSLSALSQTNSSD